MIPAYQQQQRRAPFARGGGLGGGRAPFQQQQGGGGGFGQFNRGGFSAGRGGLQSGGGFNNNRQQPLQQQQQQLGGVVDPVQLPYLQFERRLAELCKRYPKLQLSEDLIKELAPWVHMVDALERVIDGPGTLTLDVENAVTVAEPAASSSKSATESTADRYFAKVLLITKTAKPVASATPAVTTGDVNADASAAAALALVAAAQIKAAAAAHVHPHQELKFVVASTPAGTPELYGGEWEAEDGEDPANDPTVLIRTAFRHAYAACGLDLSPCPEWPRLIEIQYRRPNGAIHHTVIFAPNLSATTTAALAYAAGSEDGATPPPHVYKSVFKELVTTEVDVPAIGDVPARKDSTTKEVEKMVSKPIELSLQALLNLGMGGAPEATVEVCLAARAIEEVLSNRNAQKLLEVLKVKKQEADEQALILKRKRDTEAEERQERLEKLKEENDAKRQKLEEAKKISDEAKAKKQEAEANLSEEELAKIRAEEEAKEQEAKKEREEEFAKQQEEATAKRVEAEKLKKEEEDAKKAAEDAIDQARGYKIVKVTVAHVNDEVAAPFRYFDKPLGLSGQIRRDVLEGVLYALGKLTPREVEGLLRAVGMHPGLDHRTPLIYKRLASYTETEERQMPVTAPVVVVVAAPEAEKAEEEELMPQTEEFAEEEQQQQQEQQEEEEVTA